MAYFIHIHKHYLFVILRHWKQAKTVYIIPVPGDKQKMCLLTRDHIKHHCYI